MYVFVCVVYIGKVRRNLRHSFINCYIFSRSNPGGAHCFVETTNNSWLGFDGLRYLSCPRICLPDFGKSDHFKWRHMHNGCDRDSFYCTGYIQLADNHEFRNFKNLVELSVVTRAGQIDEFQSKLIIGFV